MLNRKVCLNYMICIYTTYNVLSFRRGKKAELVSGLSVFKMKGGNHPYDFPMGRVS